MTDAVAVSSPLEATPLEATRTSRLVVLCSGTGTNLQAVMDACAAGTIRASVVAVGSNRPDALALGRANDAGIVTFVVTTKPGEERGQYDSRLAEHVAAHRPDWIVLAGFMRLLTMNFLGRFPGKVVNVHPALPGAFPGTKAIERAYDAAQRGEIDRTGIMIHLVPDEGVDDGPVLAVAEVPIVAGVDVETLMKRMHDVEHDLLTTTLARLVLEDR